jgi:dihydrofolate reductase
MKVELVAVSTLDGFIARPNGSIDWASPEDHAWFTSYARKVGVMVTGRKTFEVALKRGLLPLKQRVVMTHEPGKFDPQPNTIFTDKSPHEVLQLIADGGHDHVIIAGGSQIYGKFLEENLVDEVRLTIEPVAIGEGIPLFAHAHKEHRFKLLETKSLNDSTIQFHYQVIK